MDSLFAAAYDSNYGVKEAAIITIGRLTAVNPAYNLPTSESPAYLSRFRIRNRMTLKFVKSRLR